jgi:ABC-type nitrate/sulfonate/bicarbonate transport system substrate-binding protein
MNKRFAGLMLAGLAALGGCGGTTAPASAPASAAAASKLASAAGPSGAAASAGTDSRAPLSATKLRYAISVSSGLQVLPELAVRAGYFKEEGLDVTVNQIPGTPQVIAALNNGEIDMSSNDSTAIAQAHLNGVPNFIVAVPVTKPAFDLMVPASITKPEQLAGKTIAISKLCDNNCVQISQALETWGLKPQKDVAFLPLNDFPGSYAGLTSGQVAGAMLAPPFNFQAQKAGYHSLADFTQLPVNYPGAAVQTVQRFASAHPDTLVAALRAYVKAVRRYKADKAFVVDVYRTFLKSDDTEVLGQTWDYYQRLMQPDPTPSVDGIKFVLEQQLTDVPAAKTANPADFINTSYIKQAMAGL